MRIKGFYPQFDFPDRPLERVAIDLSTELIASSYKWDGITIRRPDLHAAGIELGILASQRMRKNKNWAPSPGPPLFLVLSLGYEKACEWSGWKGKGAEEKAGPPQGPIKK